MGVQERPNPEYRGQSRERGKRRPVPWELDYLRLKWSQRGGGGVVLGARESRVQGLVMSQVIGKAPS